LVRVGYSETNSYGTTLGYVDGPKSYKYVSSGGNNTLWMVNIHNEVYQRVGMDTGKNKYGYGTLWT
jgi:hypothetical protein